MIGFPPVSNGACRHTPVSLQRKLPPAFFLNPSRGDVSSETRKQEWVGLGVFGSHLRSDLHLGADAIREKAGDARGAALHMPLSLSQAQSLPLPPPPPSR